MKIDLNWKTKTLKDGRKIREAPATEDFWKLWRQHQSTIKNAGYNVSQYPKGSGKWTVTDWNDRSTPEQAQANAVQVAASRAARPSPGFSVPSPEGFDYYPYQLAGIEYLTKHAPEGCLIGDPMGVGKTIIVAGLLNLERPSTVLIVCPSFLKINWHRELARWLVRPRRVDIVNGSGKIDGIDPANLLREIPSEPDVVIVNYDILSKHKDALLAVQWGTVVFDEGHYLKSPSAARTKVALKIKSDRKLVLSGTPIPNRPREIQTIAGYLDRENFGDKWGFLRRYCDPQENRWGTSFDGATNLAELQERLRSTILLRRDREQVLPDLPPKVRQVIVLDPSKYSEVLKSESKLEFESLDEAIKEMDEDSTKFEELSSVRHETGLAKVGDVVEHLLTINNPVVVFAHHQDVIAALAEALTEAGKSVVTVTGADSINKRQQAVDSFQSGEADIFIGSIKACGVGITLTRASHVLFCEIDWVPASLSQAEDRCYRIGQEADSVLVQHIVISGSIDSRMVGHLIRKQEVISASLDDDLPQVAPAPVEVPVIVDAAPTLEEIASDLPAVNEKRLGNLLKVFADAAANGQKLYLNAEGLVISAAPETGNNPGCLYVKDEGGEYQGKVTASGDFRALREAHHSTATKLAKINTDPSPYLPDPKGPTGPQAASGIDLSELVAGRYAVPGGDTRLKVKISKGRDGTRWAGYVFVTDGAYHGQGGRYGIQRPGQNYEGDIADQLRAILADPFEASKEYGRLTSTCGVCGAPLENEQSVAAGIGPICANRF